MKNKQNGFFKIIIIIVIALVLLNYYHISVYDAIDWLKSLSLSKIIDWFKELFNSVK